MSGNRSPSFRITSPIRPPQRHKPVFICCSIPTCTNSHRRVPPQEERQERPLVLRMEAGQSVGVITRASGITPHPYASMYLLSYEVLWTKMHKDASASRRPILGTSLPHGDHKKRRCAAHQPSGTGRSVVRVQARIGRWQTSRFALASPQIDSRSPSDGGLRARYASGEMLASLAFAPPPLATFVPVQFRRWWGSPQISTGSAGSRFARHAADRWSLPTVGTGGGVQVGGRCRSRTNSLATLASFVQIPSVDPKKLCASLPNRRGR